MVSGIQIFVALHKSAFYAATQQNHLPEGNFQMLATLALILTLTAFASTVGMVLAKEYGGYAGAARSIRLTAAPLRRAGGSVDDKEPDPVDPSWAIFKRAL
jgi:hypothetical protein